MLRSIATLGVSRLAPAVMLAQYRNCRICVRFRPSGAIGQHRPESCSSNPLGFTEGAAQFWPSSYRGAIYSGLYRPWPSRQVTCLLTGSAGFPGLVGVLPASRQLPRQYSGRASTHSGCLAARRCPARRHASYSAFFPLLAATGTGSHCGFAHRIGSSARYSMLLGAAGSACASAG